MTKQIPNLFTLLNLVFGCLAIVAILQNGIVIQYDADGSQLIDIPEKIWMASLFIGLAAVIDFLDGFVARLFKASSEMGKQLDSLADVVSFLCGSFYDTLSISANEYGQGRRRAHCVSALAASCLHAGCCRGMAVGKI